MTSIKQFLKQTLLFISFPIGMGIFLLLFFNYQGNKSLDEFQFNARTKVIFIGDSHVQQAINDKIVPNSMNLAISAESFYFSFYKLKGLLNNNHHIKKIFLGFSYHSLSSYYDDFIFGIKSKNISPQYYFILPWTEQLKFLRYNSKCLPSYLKNILKIGLNNTFLRDNKYTYMGQYDNVFKKTHASQNSMDKRLLFQFYKNSNLRSFSNFNIYYLEQIINLCKNKNVELILLNTPLHSYYTSKIPIEYKNKYNEIIRENQLVVIDFKCVTLDNDCFIPDGDHVSEKGAFIVSNYIKEYLERRHND